MGSVFGAVGGLVFVLVNAGALPGALVWRLAAVVAFLAIGWFVVVRGPQVDAEPPSRAALRIYLISVAAMVVGIVAGAYIIRAVLHRPDAVLVWVVFVVGLHFLPFAQAFRLPVFRWLSVSLVAVALVGFVGLAVSGEVAASWTGVAAGVLLLLFSAFGPRLSRPEVAHR
jgi:hypothetical protein